MSLKVSQSLDGQLSAQEARAALDELAADDDQRDRFTLYALIEMLFAVTPLQTTHILIAFWSG